MRRKLELAGNAFEEALSDLEQGLFYTNRAQMINKATMRQHKRIVIMLSVFVMGLFYHDLIIEPTQTVILTLAITFLFVQRKHIVIAWTKEHPDNKGGEV
ncbi:MAG: hypothetical protein PHG25_02375 [Candidatus Pacebacteria bacterium]|nr:hypothetical protein [Candidatus Paceibacterota bacterium]